MPSWRCFCHCQKPHLQMNLNLFFNASFVCNRTQGVRPGGLISLHISCLQFIHAHRPACCKHSSNLHYQISESFHTGESEQNPPRQTCSTTHTHRHTKTQAHTHTHAGYIPLKQQQEGKASVFILSIITTDMFLLPVVRFVITRTTTL